MAGCTTVALNYLAYARVLAASWARHHPDCPFHVLLLDAEGPGPDTQGLDVLAPRDLGIDPVELRIQQAMYGPLEFATALKPHLLARLLRDAEAAVFVDPDSDVFAPLDAVGAAAAEHGVALIPHARSPFPDDGRQPSERGIQVTGVFNTGLIGVGRPAGGFLDWWASRLRRGCVIDRGAGLFVDQRYVDWVPAYFSHRVLRDPSLNVAFWNLHERSLTRGADGFRVDGGPLRHFHFSGFNPRDPSALTAKGGSPQRITLEDSPALRELCAGYAERVMAAGHERYSRIPYGLGRTASGTPLRRWERAAYREAVIDAERRGAPLPPSPFDPAEAAAFERLAAAPGDAVDLSALARARLEQLRAEYYEEAARWPPASRAGRLAFRARRALRRLTGRAPGRASAGDRALLGLLIDVENRLGAPVTVPPEAEHDASWPREATRL